MFSFTFKILRKEQWVKFYGAIEKKSCSFSLLNRHTDKCFGMTRNWRVLTVQYYDDFTD